MSENKDKKSIGEKVADAVKNVIKPKSVVKGNVTVKEADANAERTTQKADLEKLILEEAMALTDGKQSSVQQMMAYCRQLKKRIK